MLPSNSKKKKPSTAQSKIVLTPAQKAAVAQAMGWMGKTSSVPASLRPRTPKGVGASKVGLGARSPLTRTAGRMPNREQVEATGKAFTGYDKNNTALTNAALVAASVLPIPGLKGVGAVARAGKVASTAGKGSKAVKKVTKAKPPKMTRAEARDVELREIKRLMQPEPRPARGVTKFSLDDSISRAMRGKSGKVMSTGPKPVRGDFKSASAFKTAMKKWENALEANRAAARAGGDSLPAVAKKAAVKRPSAKKTPAAPAAKKSTPAVRKQTDAPVAKKTTAKKTSVKKPSAKPINESKSLAARDSKPGNAVALRPGSTVATRPGKAAPSKTGSKEVAKDGVPMFTWTRPGAAKGSRGPQLAIEGPKASVKGAAPRSPKAIEAAKTAKKRKFPKKTVIGLGAASLGLAAIGDGIDRASKKDDATTTAKATGRDSMGMNAAERAAYRTKNGLLDKYGRKISRAEFNRREAYRARKEEMSPKQRAAAEKKELARRKKYRETKAVKRFGKAAATKKTRKVGSTYLDDRARAYLK